MESVVPRAARNGVRPGVQADLRTKAHRDRRGLRPAIMEADLKNRHREETGADASSFPRRNKVKQLFSESERKPNPSERVGKFGSFWKTESGGVFLLRYSRRKTGFRRGEAAVTAGNKQRAADPFKASINQTILLSHMMLGCKPVRLLTRFLESLWVTDGSLLPLRFTGSLMSVSETVSVQTETT